tara:strand:+ start:10030 stop:10362 length:333 start_codon:yes stop_codon:yes gene_type:complete
MIDAHYFWTIIVCLALGTISIRISIIAVSGRIQISERARELFSYIPAAILPAFFAPAVFYHQGQVSWLLGRERLFVLLLAILVCLKTRSTVVTIVFGIVALYSIAHLTGG